MESIVYLLDIVYFVYISDNWKYLQIPNVVLSFCGALWIWYWPETPRYLVAKKRFDEARACFKTIAKVNGANYMQIDEWIFEREAMDKELPIGVDIDE